MYYFVQSYRTDIRPNTGQLRKKQLHMEQGRTSRAARPSPSGEWPGGMLSNEIFGSNASELENRRSALLLQDIRVI